MLVPSFTNQAAIHDLQLELSLSVVGPSRALKKLQQSENWFSLGRFPAKYFVFVYSNLPLHPQSVHSTVDRMHKKRRERVDKCIPAVRSYGDFGLEHVCFAVYFTLGPNFVRQILKLCDSSGSSIIVS